MHIGSMTAPTRASSPPRGEPRLLWATALAVAGFGNWMFYDARPGINWILWTAAAVAGLLLVSRSRGNLSSPVLITGGTAIVIAGAASVTANGGLLGLIALGVACFLAMQMLLSTADSPQSITARFTFTAPFVGLRHAVSQAIRRSVEATHLIRSARARGWVRGLAITLPVLAAFALLLLHEKHPG